MIGVAAGRGGDVAKMAKDIDQGGSFWEFRLPQKRADKER
jgi:hypothetical protein